VPRVAVPSSPDGPDNQPARMVGQRVGDGRRQAGHFNLGLYLLIIRGHHFADPDNAVTPAKADVIRRWDVPTLAFADDADGNDRCCMIDTIRTVLASRGIVARRSNTSSITALAMTTYLGATPARKRDAANDA
jgi:hypothetical protein